mmetsp:Transcript_25099/g.41153  ORF Transcript_25099/g.41153 Transcript_25099/m.41153 type:complete len:90 (+) Transcript_25099:931-1200(+)
MRFLLDNLRSEIMSILRKTNGQIDSTLGARSEDVNALDSLREEAKRIVTIIQEQQNRLVCNVEYLARFIYLHSHPCSYATFFFDFRLVI